MRLRGSSWKALGILAFALACKARQAPPEPLPEPLAVWREPATGIEFVYLPPGEFSMGSGPEVASRQDNEVRHEVVLRQGIFFGRHEVTQQQWQTVMGTRPSQFQRCGPDCPVESVSFVDVAEFIARLTRLSPGHRFRLPTEAEWERACRAGTETPFATGPRLAAEQANFDGRYPYADGPSGPFVGRPTPVGSYPPNPWGIFDLHGNVWEWCSDGYGPYPSGKVVDPVGPKSGRLRVIRGGSWAFDGNSARCALRYTHSEKDSGYSLGFRLVREMAAAR